MTLDQLIEKLQKKQEEGLGGAVVVDCTWEPVEDVYVVDYGKKKEIKIV